MGAALTTSFAMSFLIHNSVNPRDIQNGLLAGAIVGGSASFYITNVAFSILCGIIAAILQPIF